MIYYHFGSKQKLYAAVMEAAYGGMRSEERDLHLEELPPEEAMRRLVEATFDVRAAHPEWVRLITSREHGAGRPHLGRPDSITRVNATVLELVRDLLKHGEREDVFRSGLDAWQVHLLITSLCFYRVSNRYTWQAIFELDLWEKQNAELQRQMVVEAVLRYVRRDDAAWRRPPFLEEAE